MSRHRRGKLTGLMTAAGIILIIAAVGVTAWQIAQGRMAESAARKTMEKMQQMIPQYEEDDAAATGIGEDPLPVIEVDGVSFVGYLEIPGQDLKLPVADKEYDGKDFAFHDSGSPVKGEFRIGGRDSRGVFGPIDDIQPGQTVVFIDVNGMRYKYKITGMTSARDWQGLDHDLLLYRGISRNKKLVVFGTLQ